jgi:hypothetical protein
VRSTIADESTSRMNSRRLILLYYSTIVATSDYTRYGSRACLSLEREYVNAFRSMYVVRHRRSLPETTGKRTGMRTAILYRTYTYKSIREADSDCAGHHDVSLGLGDG